MKLTDFVNAVLSVFVGWTLVVTPAQAIAGTNTTKHSCAAASNVFNQLYVEGAPFIRSLSDAAFDDYIAWARECIAFDGQDRVPRREKILADAIAIRSGDKERVMNDYRHLMQQRSEQIAIAAAADAERAAKIKEEEAQRTAMIEAEAERKADELSAARETAYKNKIDLDVCMSSASYLLFFAASKVVDDVDALKQFRAEQIEQRKIAAISGVRNLREERSIGESIYSAQKDLPVDFKEYKQRGGKASTPQKVEPLEDPCKGMPPGIPTY